MLFLYLMHRKIFMFKQGPN